MRSVELFAGAGGLALGCELAGFHPALVVEWDRWACDTIRRNQTADYPLVRGWEVVEGDVRSVDWGSVEGPIDLVSGGPPCQPFSMGGKHGAADDPRDMFPAAIEVIRTVRPRAFIIENVRGLTRSTFADYYRYILLRLSYPELTSHEGDTWLSHYHRLRAERTSSEHGLTYDVVPTVVNAADYGVPQQRHRVIIVGFRSDVDTKWTFPDATHSKQALLHEQWGTGSYWERHDLKPGSRPVVPDMPTGLPPGAGGLRPWRTVRDALTGLPEPSPHNEAGPPARGTAKALNHVMQPGARQYAGHTGSHLDLPAKTLKAGDHGVPGGENMMLRPDGSVRYFTVRESARLQTFPDRYELHGSWTEAMRQLGNAVPVLLAQRLAGSVAEHLSMADLGATRGSGSNRMTA